MSNNTHEVLLTLEDALHEFVVRVVPAHEAANGTVNGVVPKVPANAVENGEVGMFDFYAGKPKKWIGVAYIPPAVARSIADQLQPYEEEKEEEEVVTWDTIRDELDGAHTEEMALLRAAATRREERGRRRAELTRDIDAEQAADDAKVKAQIHALVERVAGIEADCSIGDVLAALDEEEPSEEEYDQDALLRHLEESYRTRHECYCRLCDDHRDYDDEDMPDFTEQAAVIAALNLRAAGLNREEYEAEQEAERARAEEAQKQRDEQGRQVMRAYADTLGLKIQPAKVDSNELEYHAGGSVFVFHRADVPNYGPRALYVNNVIGILRQPGEQQQFMVPEELVACIKVLNL
jgi:hypothetical protein